MFGFMKRGHSATLPLVEVVYRALSNDYIPTTTPGKGYVYQWGAPVAPQVGMRVFAPVSGGRPEAAVVIAVGAALPRGFTRQQLGTITQISEVRPPTRRG